MLNILMNFLYAADFMKYSAIKFFNQKNKYRSKSLGLKHVLTSKILFRKNEVWPFLDC